jgi:hypothetical protein
MLNVFGEIGKTWFENIMSKIVHQSVDDWRKCEGAKVDTGGGRVNENSTVQVEMWSQPLLSNSHDMNSTWMDISSIQS